VKVISALLLRAQEASARLSPSLGWSRLGATMLKCESTSRHLRSTPPIWRVVLGIEDW